MMTQSHRSCRQPYRWRASIILCSMIGFTCALWMTVPAAWSSDLGQQVTTIFQSNRWTAMNSWLRDKSRIYIRIPNLQSGFLTPGQVRSLFAEMEKRFETRRFKLLSDEGSNHNRWVVRAGWKVYDRDLDKVFDYKLDIGWESDKKTWRLLELQAQ